MTNAEVTSLTTDAATGGVTGVRYRPVDEENELELPAAAVVLTTGGVPLPAWDWFLRVARC